MAAITPSTCETFTTSRIESMHVPPSASRTMPSRNEILTREVTEKLRLEAIVKPGIRKIFKRVVDDFRVSVARTGQAPSLSRHRTSFETLLEDHYRRVQKSFGGM